MSSIEEDLVFAFATKGWMMYFGSALSAFSGSRRVPEMAILSKCVPSNELGQIMAVFGAFQTIAELSIGSLMKQVYNLTIDTFIGAQYCISAGLSFVCILVMLVIYRIVHLNEKKFGTLGTRYVLKEEDVDHEDLKQEHLS